MDAIAQAHYRISGGTYFLHCNGFESSITLAKETFAGEETLGVPSLQGRVISFESDACEEGQRVALLEAVKIESGLFGKYMALVSPGPEVQIGIYSFSARLLPLVAMQQGALQGAEKYKVITIEMFLGRDQEGYLQRFVVVTKKNRGEGFEFSAVDRKGGDACEESIAYMNQVLVSGSSINTTFDNTDRARAAEIRVANREVPCIVHAAGKEHSVLVSDLGEVVGQGAPVKVVGIFARMNRTMGSEAQYTEGLLKSGMGKVLAITNIEEFLANHADVKLDGVQKVALARVFSEGERALSGSSSIIGRCQLYVCDRVVGIAPINA